MRGAFLERLHDVDMGKLFSSVLENESLTSFVTRVVSQHQVQMDQATRNFEKVTAGHHKVENSWKKSLAPGELAKILDLAKESLAKVPDALAIEPAKTNYEEASTMKRPPLLSVFFFGRLIRL